LRKRLDDVGRPEPVHPYNFYAPRLQAMTSGNTTVREWRRNYLYEGAAAPPAEKKVSAD